MARCCTAVALLLALAREASASQVLLHAAANRAAGVLAKNSGGGAGPNWSVYHRTDALLATVRARVSGCAHARSWFVDVDAGAEGSVLVVAVGEDLGKARAEAGWFAGREGRVKAMVAFGEHGREFVSAEVGLRFIERACPLEGEVMDVGLMEELRRTDFLIVPVVGAAGRRLAEGGRFCERGNARGVDVNRNFGFEWGKSDKDTVLEEEKPGSAAFSEGETRVLHVLGMHFRPHVYVSVHSGERALIVPWDSGGGGGSEGGVVRKAVGPEVREVADSVQAKHCKECRVGAASELLGYRAFGTGVDYMYGVVHAPIAMTWEVYGDEAAHEDDCVRMFNPVGEDMYWETVENWAMALETLSAAVHRLGSGKSRGGGAGRSMGVGGVGRALFGDAWARVASRLGSAAWTDTAYNAAIRVDEEAFTARGRRRLEEKAAAVGSVGHVGGRKDREGSLRGRGAYAVAALEAEAVLHPVAAVFGALLTVLSFSCMAFMLRHVMVVRGRRPVRISSACNGAPPVRRGRQHVRSGSGLLQTGGGGAYFEKVV